MVLPSEKEGASARHHQYERPDAAFPCKRLRPEAMAELAEALEVGWMDGRMDGRMDGWMKGRAIHAIYIHWTSNIATDCGPARARGGGRSSAGGDP